MICEMPEEKLNEIKKRFKDFMLEILNTCDNGSDAIVMCDLIDSWSMQVREKKLKEYEKSEYESRGLYSYELAKKWVQAVTYLENEFGKSPESAIKIAETLFDNRERHIIGEVLFNQEVKDEDF